ncbi:hypothetical protein WH249_21390 [Enterobacter ludwigii]
MTNKTKLDTPRSNRGKKKYSDDSHKKTIVSVELNETQNAFLTALAVSHGRSKRKELANILEIYRALAASHQTGIPPVDL